LVVIPYEFEKYDAVSKSIYQILIKTGDFVQAVSCDEAYIDVSFSMKKKLREEEGSSSCSSSFLMEGGEDGDDHQASFDRLQSLAYRLADEIRREIFSATGCPASIGIARNLLLARLATTKAKPNGVFFLSSSNCFSLLNDLPVSGLPGFGYNIKEKCLKLKIETVKDVHSVSPALLKKELGEKTALSLLSFAQGSDDRVLENKIRQSLGSDINWGIRFTEQFQVDRFLLEFSEEVFERMTVNDLCASHITVNVMKKLYEGEPTKFLGCGHCQNYSKSLQSAQLIRSMKQLHQLVVQLYQEINIPLLEVRGVGIHLKKLVRNNNSVSSVSSSLPSHEPALERSIPFSVSASFPPSSSSFSSSSAYRSSSHQRISGYFTNTEKTAEKVVRSSSSPLISLVEEKSEVYDDMGSHQILPLSQEEGNEDNSKNNVQDLLIRVETVNSIDLTESAGANNSNDSQTSRYKSIVSLPSNKNNNRGIDSFFSKVVKSAASSSLDPSPEKIVSRGIKRPQITSFFETKSSQSGLNKKKTKLEGNDNYHQKKEGEEENSRSVLADNGIDWEVFQSLPEDIRREQIEFFRSQKKEPRKP
jgi:nucleotidyltransferase/DNA polymerase involved in DNA repair